MSLTMLVEDDGRNYTAAEYGEWLTETGFRNARRIHIDAPAANGVIIAEKPQRPGQPSVGSSRDELMAVSAPGCFSSWRSRSIRSPSW